jgi:hypothetical protein
MELLTRFDLARRWNTCTRTIDRKRELGLLPWVDLAGGMGSRPSVRFRLTDVEDYERRMLQKAVMQEQAALNRDPHQAGVEAL